MAEEKIKNAVSIPPDTPEIHSSGGAAFITPYNIRLLLFDDEIVRNGEFLEEGSIAATRNAKCELIFHPQVAESVANLLLKQVEKYKKEFCEIVEEPRD